MMSSAHAPHDWRLRFGRRYPVPRSCLSALERVFGHPVYTVRVVEHSLYARAHAGMNATTRPNLILIAAGGDEFVSNPALLLHEYFHVLRQWNTGRLTRWRYIVESVRRGYRENRFEREAREFAAGAIDQYRAFLMPTSS